MAEHDPKAGPKAASQRAQNLSGSSDARIERGLCESS